MYSTLKPHIMKFLQKHAKFFAGAGVGIVASLLVFLYDPAKVDFITPGAISAGHADSCARAHSDHWPKTWRMDSRGVWYANGQVNNYVKKIDQFNKLNDSMANTLGYSVKLAVCFGAARQKGSNDKQLMTMFMPVLVFMTDTTKVLDVFEARKHYKDNDMVSMPKWEKEKGGKKLTFYMLYKTFYAEYDAVPSKVLSKKDSTSSEIFFDDGNMFP